MEPALTEGEPNHPEGKRKMGILEKHNFLERIRKLVGIMAMVAIILSISVGAAYAAMPESDSGDIGIQPTFETGYEKEINTYREEKIEEIPFKTLYQYSASLASGETEVKVKGETGTKRVVGIVVTENGEIVERQEISTEMLKAPKDEVILVGSFSDIPDANYDFPPVLSVNDVSYDASVYTSLKPNYTEKTKGGDEVVEYALQFLGNPYVWGGTSLTNGTDCSGFVYSVFNSLGYDVPRLGVENYYPISVDEMLPGDVISYPDHYAIYIGGGLEVGALNSSKGICITPVGYVGEGYVAVRIAN